MASKVEQERAIWERAEARPEVVAAWDRLEQARGKLRVTTIAQRRAKAQHETARREHETALLQAVNRLRAENAKRATP